MGCTAGKPGGRFLLRCPLRRGEQCRRNPEPTGPPAAWAMDALPPNRTRTERRTSDEGPVSQRAFLFGAERLAAPAATSYICPPKRRKCR
jgi:hypothetical protein